MSEIVDAHIVEPGRLAHPPPRLLQIGQMRAFGAAGDDTENAPVDPPAVRDNRG